jgi:4-amino-4-deoxy-L-arabinose transferase-like glycosyltransferase
VTPPRLAIVAVLALALVVRIGVIVATPDFKPIYDAADFDRIARHIDDHGHYPDTYFAAPGTPTALNPPGYPHVLALTYKVAGQHLDAGRALSALLGTLTVLLLILIASRLAGPTAGLVTGVLAALYPPLVATSASLISESVFLPLVLLLMLVLLTRREVEGRAAIWVALGAGVICGLAALTRFVGTALVLVVLVWIWQRAQLPVRRRLAMGAVAVLAAALTISPWTIRNYRAFHEFVPVATEGGTGAVGTYNSESAKPGPVQGTWRPNWQLGNYKPLLNNELNEAELDQIWREDAIEYARDHPTYPFVALVRNSGRLLGLGPGHRYLETTSYNEMGIPRWAHKWTRLSVYLMALLALAGAVILLRGRLDRLRTYAFLWLTPLLLFTIPAFALGGPRYRVPVDVFLVLAAGTGLAALAQARARTRTAR